MTAEEISSRRPVVTLDLWLTLIAELDGTQRSPRRYVTRARLAGEVLSGFGLHVAEGELIDASQKISQMVGYDHDLGVDLTFRDRVAQMLSLIDEDLIERLSDPGLDAVAAAVDRAFLDSPPSFLPASKQVLEHLSTVDVSVALISNVALTSADAYREWFAAEGVLDLFDELTFSNEIACAKPNPAIFCPTIEKVESVPEAGLHIGDNLLTDVSGAAAIGMKTGWISGHDDREPIVEPDYTLQSIGDLPAIVERWLETI